MKSINRPKSQWLCVSSFKLPCSAAAQLPPCGQSPLGAECPGLWGSGCVCDHCSGWHWLASLALPPPLLPFGGHWRLCWAYQVGLTCPLTLEAPPRAVAPLLSSCAGRGLLLGAGSICGEEPMEANTSWALTMVDIFLSVVLSSFSSLKSARMWAPVLSPLWWLRLGSDLPDTAPEFCPSACHLLGSGAVGMGSSTLNLNL